MEFYVALILDILPPEPCENDFLACTLPVCGAVYGDLSRPTQSQAVIPAAHAGVVLKTGVLLGIRVGPATLISSVAKLSCGISAFPSMPSVVFINLPRTQPYIKKK